MIFDVRERADLIVGSPLVADVEPRLRSTLARAPDTRAGHALLRQFATTGQVVHDEKSTDLDQVTTVKVRELPSGLTIVAGSRADLVRASAWALLAAHRSTPEPAIN